MSVDKKVRNRYYEKLYRMRGELPVGFKSKISDNHLRTLTMSLMDGTVFEIVKELEEIQQLNEKSLHNKRLKVVSEQSAKRLLLIKNHKDEIKNSNPGSLTMLRTRHEQEMKEMERQLTEQLKVTDQEVILELDQIFSEQQSTLQQAAVPFFKITNNPHDIQMQSHVLNFIQRLHKDVY